VVALSSQQFVVLDLAAGGAVTPASRTALPFFPAALLAQEDAIQHIAFNPARPEEMYAALEVRGVIRSTDAGESWTDCSDHLIAPRGDGANAAFYTRLNDVWQRQVDTSTLSNCGSVDRQPLMVL
jgi:hypothetical protein